MLNDLRSPSHLKGYTVCLRLAGNKYQLPTVGKIPIILFSHVSEALLPIISKIPFCPGRQYRPDGPSATFLISFEKSGTFKNPTQVN